MLVIEGATRPGAKILVSGGGRCNVTNTEVSAKDFNGGSPAVIRRVLAALTVPETVEFFREIGVPLVEETGGKLFPKSHRARDVLDALLGELARTAAVLRTGTRVTGVANTGGAFRVATSAGILESAAVIVATGGLALPKSGSDGVGYGIARSFGHSIVPTTPALVPLCLEAEGPRAIHQRLSGVAVPARLSLTVDGRVARRSDGPMLWTHFGISGPVVLDMSRHWLRAGLDGEPAELGASLLPALDHASLDRAWVDLARTRSRATVASTLASWLPASAAEAILAALSLRGQQLLAEFTRDDRRLLVGALLAWRLAVTGSRGYTYAEVTAGGVDLSEVSSSTLESRKCPGLYFVGEVLDADGRLGGFNFQWAWSSGRVAGGASAK